MSGHCLRCHCPDCDRDPAGEMHGHNCTDGTHCIEKARNDTIASLRARLAEVEGERERDARIEAAVAAERERCARIVEGNEVQGQCVEWPAWGTGNRSVDDRTVSLTKALAAAIREQNHDDTKIPVMNEKMSFEEAFSAARAVGAPLFDWRGTTYTSQLDKEVERPEIEPKIVRWRDADTAPETQDE